MRAPGFELLETNQEDDERGISDFAGNDREGVITWGLRDADIFSAGSRG